MWRGIEHKLSITDKLNYVGQIIFLMLYTICVCVCVEGGARGVGVFLAISSPFILLTPSALSEFSQEILPAMDNFV